jgi:hypothetical protein
MATTVAAVVWLLLLVAPSSLQISYAQSTVGMGESDWWASACDELLAPQYCDYLNPVKLEGVREQPNYNFTGAPSTSRSPICYALMLARPFTELRGH